MQQGHPRRKQLSRARHEMYAHRNRKAAAMAEALKATISLIGKSAAAAGRLIAKYFKNAH